jgi:hypothetical protein
MRKAMLLLGATALAGCGQSNDTANQVAKAPAKKKAAYCFFKEPDTKAWTAARDKDGNIVVKGKAFRQDPRYKAVLGPATVTGTRAEISPGVSNNDTGYAAPENWWDLTATIANSAAVDSVTVTCGAKTLAELKVPPKS